MSLCKCRKCSKCRNVAVASVAVGGVGGVAALGIYTHLPPAGPRGRVIYSLHYYYTNTIPTTILTTILTTNYCYTIYQLLYSLLYWPGELFDRIVAKGSYCESDASSVIATLCGALDYLHGKKVGHPCTGPENLSTEH